MLEVSALKSSYGRIEVLHGIDIRVGAGEIVALVGANGAGKTTLLRCISGLQPTTAGNITFRGKKIDRSPAHRRTAAGLVQAPEGRQIFSNLTVVDNLRLGAFLYDDAKVLDDLGRIYAMFPVLEQRRNHAAGGLSGGQQQMLAIGRALMSRPTCLMLDEPGLGLAPIIVRQIMNIIQELRDSGITIVIIDQNVHEALSIADRAYVIETGRVAIEGPCRDLIKDPAIRKWFLGVA